jgi:aspartyl-tRNA(Asn)/glutamyl-tRNA(Gln) amidotransferase subunit B
LVGKEGLERIHPKGLVAILRFIDEGRMSRNTAKDLFREYLATGDDPERIIQDRGLFGVMDEEKVAQVIDLVIEENAGAVQDFRGGKEKAFGFLVGQVMRITKGKVDPVLVNRLLRERLVRE